MIQDGDEEQEIFGMISSSQGSCSLTRGIRTQKLYSYPTILIQTIDSMRDNKNQMEIERVQGRSKEK